MDLSRQSSCCLINYSFMPRCTSEMVVAALRILLPTDLKFIISDRGSHFSSKSFTQFATEANFLHVLIARHTCTHRRCGVVRSQTGLPNVLSAQSRSGLLTKPGLMKKIYRNSYASFCSNTMNAHIKDCPSQAYLPMNTPTVSGWCDLLCLTFTYPLQKLAI